MFNERIFSIGISKFILNGLNDDLLCEKIKEKRSTKVGLTYGERDLEISDPVLQTLNEVVIKQSAEIIDGVVASSRVKLVPEVKRVWGNHNLNADICIPHVHRDSFLSAVYYPKNTDGTIHFHCPWMDNILSHIPIATTDNWNEFNSSYYEYTPESRTLIIFPANLLHFVIPTEGERYSIVYDIGVKHEHV